jgi:hypothetical protein
LENAFKTGSNVWYAAGGGGGNENSNWNQQARTNGIGGQTNVNGSNRPTDGVTSTGSGGGGGTHACVMPAGTGGDGIVVIRYAV